MLDGRLDFAEFSRQGLHRSNVPMHRRGAAVLWLAAPKVIIFGCGSSFPSQYGCFTGSRGIYLIYFASLLWRKGACNAYVHAHACCACN